MNHFQHVIESFYADIWNRHDKTKIPELLHTNFTFRGSLGQNKTGHDGFGAYVDFVHAALANYRCDILELVIEAPKAFAKIRASGLHRSEFFGFAPTGKYVEWAGAALFTFKGSKVSDLWVLGDVYGLMKMLEQNAINQKS
jgi:predicted ester cyclase